METETIAIWVASVKDGAFTNLLSAVLPTLSQQSSPVLILTDIAPDTTFPTEVKVCVVENDLVTALLPYFALLDGRELEVQLVSSASNWSLSIQQQLPQALEQLAYMQLRLQYAPFVDNALLNAPELSHPIIAYSDCCEGQTAVVLGAAPSIDKTLPWLKANREKVVVFAVARLARRLRAEGLIPDFWVASDPTEATLTHTKGLEKFQSQSVLIAQHYASPVLLEIWQGPLLYWGPDWPQHSKDFQTETNVEIEGGTVANLAILSALGLGCKTVYCAGMDFCFESSGKTHEGESLESTQGIELERHETVENYLGEVCTTTTEFLNAVEILPQQLAVLTQRYGLSADFELFNVNEQAAKIDGIDVIDLERIALPEKRSFDRNQLVQALMPSEKVKSKKLKATLTTLQRQQTFYRDLYQLTQKGLKAFEQTPEAAMGLTDEAVTFIQKVQKLHKKLEKQVKNDKAFIQRYGFEAFTDLIRLAKELEAKPQDKRLLYRYFQSAFSAYGQTVLKLEVAYQQAIANTRFQLAESKRLDQFDGLSQLWLSEQRPYRFLAWQARFPEIAKKAETEQAEHYQQLVQALEDWWQNQKALSQQTFAYLSAHPHKIKSL